MRKSLWITGGLVVAAVTATAIVAHAKRGYHDHGFGYEGGYHGEERGWRRGWRREMSKEDYDAKTRSKFAKWDTNSDGVVDKAEVETRITNRMKRWSWRRRSGGRMMRGLRRFDSDGDGKVTKAEVEAFVTERFARIDLDGDGRITDADLPPMLRGQKFLSGEMQPHEMHRMRRWGRHHGRRHGHRGKRMLRRLYGADTNKDGGVTLQEMQDRASQRFARFDRNNDGAIDRADGDTLRKDMIEYRARRMLHRFGAGSDQKLTFEAFKAHRDKRFARKDRDGDGVLERGERRGGWGHGRWHRDGDEGQRRGGPQNDREDQRDRPRDPQ